MNNHTFSVRWYPEVTSQFWYKQFAGVFDKDIVFMFLWLVAVPLGCFVLHSVSISKVVLLYGSVLLYESAWKVCLC